MILTLTLTLTLVGALTYGVVGERGNRARRAALADRNRAYFARVAAATPTPVPAPLRGRRAGAAHPTDAPRTTPGRHAATGRHAAPVAPAPVMTTPTASGRVRSVHTGRLVSGYVAGVLALPLPHYATVPAVPKAPAPTHPLTVAPLPTTPAYRAARGPAFARTPITREYRNGIIGTDRRAMWGYED